MFILYISLLLVCLNSYTDTKVLRVIDSGLKKIRKDDMMLVFFVTIRHFGKQPHKAMIMMEECCEEFAGDDKDCDIIQIYGGDFGLIHPNTVKNCTLVYPTLYGYNRKGYCLVSILHRPSGLMEVSEIRHKIYFNTMVDQKKSSLLEELYDPKKISVCETTDLDPFDHCYPVDCNLKYSGSRNFFNRRIKMCQKVPLCLTNLQKELPDIVYVPNSNECRNLENSIKEKDLHKLVKKNYNFQEMVNIRCHHGEINPKTGFCVCDYGWKSEPYDPELPIYSMCTIKCERETSYGYLIFLLGFGLAICLFFLVCLCEWKNVFLIKKECSCSSEEIFYYPLEGKECDSSTSYY